MLRFSLRNMDLMPGVGPPDKRPEKAVERKQDWGNDDGGTVQVELGKSAKMLVTVEELIRHLARRGNSLMRNKAWWAK